MVKVVSVNILILYVVRVRLLNMFRAEA
jgi:hypothetical protein